MYLLSHSIRSYPIFIIQVLKDFYQFSAVIPSNYSYLSLSPFFFLKKNFENSPYFIQWLQYATRGVFVVIQSLKYNVQFKV